MKLPDTPKNRARLESLRATVAGLLAHGTDPQPLLAAQRAPRPASGPAASRGPTLRAYYATWIEQQVPPVQRPANYADYRKHLEGYVLPVLGDVVLADLRPSDVRGLQAELLTKGRPRPPGAPRRPRRGTPSRHKPLAPKTVKNILGGSLRAMLRAARADELLDRDVFAEHPWPELTTPEPDPFTATERDALLAWFARQTYRVRPGAVQPHPPYYAFVALLFWTGMRPSEAAGLQYRDLDLGAGQLLVRRSRHRWSYGEPKTRTARRTVELIPALANLLRALTPLRLAPEQPVFPHTRGGPIEPNSFLSHWYAAQRACGIRVRGLYSTKDTFVTLSAAQPNVTPLWLEQQTGVAWGTLRRHYLNALQAMATEGAHAAERLAAIAPASFAFTPPPPWQFMDRAEKRP